MLQQKGVDPLKSRIIDVASALLSLSELSISEARNAYSGVCLLPGFEALKFCPFLRPLKRIWNTSTQKYATFWDPEPILQQMITSVPLRALPEAELRSRLILLFRLLALHRGINLSRTQRTVSVVNDKFFCLVRRKGWLFPKWEEILKYDHVPSLSPFHVMEAYVAKTAHFVPQGGPLLWSLDHKKPLSSNRVNSLTKEFLEKKGLPVTHWTAHSTRGAGVFFDKKTWPSFRSRV